MGSPETEKERYADEGPQHAVTISSGFWVFDTACTQALWQAVMGDNPGHFKGPDRPVDSVSWNDVQQFLKRINALLPGLELVLPTEAQWEYACRAGTTTPFSFGETITPEQVNYDGNHPYAGGEKGLYREETVPVASLSPNPWGLYEMHGNVWEWCRDGKRTYAADALTDPVGPMEAGGPRVLRGGSWDSSAQGVRSAYRIADDPGFRISIYGFRCARVQERREPGRRAGGPEKKDKPRSEQGGGPAGVTVA
ncbi:MAG: formylglycine-generating enzyme family protein [Rhodospirillales bacterium]|nr:formylglycine-generating enzyme family protein [Rhodospirillales bacterium]